MVRELSRILTVRGMYARAALQGARALVPARLAGQPPSDDLSEAAVAVAGVRPAVDRLAAYREVCGYTAEGQVLPPTYPHVLAFPLHLLLMTAPTFPFRAIGMVHISNSIRQERSLTASDRLDLSVRAIDLGSHRRGRQVTLATEVRVASELVWREESVFLSREHPSADSADAPQRDREPPARDEGAAGPGGAAEIIGPKTWLLPGDLGRRYARASGDGNPIHLFDLTARPFGFRRHIAHGMWTMARALAELSDRLPERFQADVAFKSPLALPATAQLSARGDTSRLAFEVTAGPHASGSQRPPPTYLVGTADRL
jgi:hypothetical protein